MRGVYGRGMPTLTSLSQLLDNSGHASRPKMGGLRTQAARLGTLTSTINARVAVGHTLVNGTNARGFCRTGVRQAELA